MALTKAEIVAHLSEEVGLSKRDAKEFVESFFEEIDKSIIVGSRKFFQFSIVNRSKTYSIE